MPEFAALVFILGGHSVIVLVAGSAYLAAAAFVLVLGAVAVNMVAVLAMY